MRQKRRSSGIFVLVFFIILVAILAYVYNSKLFERSAPNIELSSVIDWNLREPIAVKIEDESGVKFLRVILSDGNNSIVLDKKVFELAQKEVALDVEFPRTGFVGNKKHFELYIEAIDASKWNFFAGNTSVKKALINVDTKRPELFIVNNSYKIIKGGAATVVFSAKDENLKELYIQTNFDKKFLPTPFYKDGYYTSLLAWPSNEESFSAMIIATDKAGNISKERIRFYLSNRKYKVSKISLKDSFLDGKITDLASEISTSSESMNKIEKFKFINETVRTDNERIIEEVTSKVPSEKIDNFHVEPFYPLKNAAAVASFGDHRFYQYNQNEVSQSFHVGLDLASTAGATIVSSNDAKVVFAKQNGIYGDNMILSHGLGMYSLYGHCSSFLVQEGENITKGQSIATTGKTGLALGDHLHFGILVQGIEVRPEEWMDTSWLKDNIFGVMDAAKKIIDR
jgi:murein DD-endopeptidase MepM/ murein hydrolase activator NlpD